jgi:outer membrane protein OmpA-like peptidoglycan-associated protein
LATSRPWTPGNQARQRLLRARAVQPKLVVNEPADEFEREADRVAERVMRMSGPGAAGPPRVQRTCSTCREELPPARVQRMCTECEEELHRKPRDGEEHHTLDIAPPLEGQIAIMRSGGEPLPHSVRAFFEPRFGRDFSNVRLHTGVAAAETASSIDALAYTTGNHIVFAAGRYAPETEPGRRLLAHELAHTIQQGHAAPSVQRLGDLTKVPAGLGCPVAVDSPTAPVTEVLFPNAGTSLTAAQRASIEAFIVSWRAAGGSTPVRVDGYASPAGPDNLNWRISCGRARAVADELRRPSSGKVPGIPASLVSLFAQGETTEFSNPTGPDRDGPNRRATISNAPAPPPPPPPPVCPAVPTATPATCSARHDAYCEAARCMPSNAWLPCVCKASGEVCEAVDAFAFTGSTGTALAACAFASAAPPGPIVSKSAWFLATNRCIWGHWRAAFDAIHDPTRSVPSGLTAEWSSAVSTCRSKGLASSDCCKAHVEAEQNAIDRCGAYSSATFGLLPTDVPGASGCSRIVAAAAPPPAFTGDFGKVSDRISYGNSRCCH